MGEGEKHSKVSYESLPLFLKFLQYLLKIIAGTIHNHDLAHQIKHVSCKLKGGM
jgi:hypothetical protein